MEEIQHGDHEGAGKMQLGYSETSGTINSLCIMDFTGLKRFNQCRQARNDLIKLQRRTAI